MPQTNASTPGKLLTADQLGERWQVPKTQVYRLAREGLIPVIRIGRYARFPLEAIDAYERQQWRPDGGPA